MAAGEVRPAAGVPRDVWQAEPTGGVGGRRRAAMGYPGPAENVDVGGRAMTEACVETWELGIGSQRELALIREALRENPAVTDGRREGVALEGSFRLEGDRILAEVWIGNGSPMGAWPNRSPSRARTFDWLEPGP